MSEDEVEKFEITDFDLENEFSMYKNRRGPTKHQQIYGIWADDSADEDEKPSFKAKKKPKNYSAPIGFVAGGVQQAGKKDKKDTIKKEENENSEDDEKPSTSFGRKNSSSESENEGFARAGICSFTPKCNQNKSNEKDKEKVKEESDEEDMDEEFEEKEDVKDIKPIAKYHSNDVTEGKTVFVKNIPFTAINDDLKQCMRQFGPVYYALICFDKFTEHSKGTGFVKFVNVEDAEKCLQAGTELTLLGNILDCVKALNRNYINSKKADKEEKKDSRNLYLVKEGVVLAGTPAAHGVSASDMAKRLQIEQYKTQMLRNLNMFVSRTRLVVHNLPASWDDSKFRQLMQKHGGERSFIKEARIMRNMKKLDSKVVGTSKEFGFVTFATHEQALTALRSLNNNPNIFSENKRPIVAFSIENKSMIKAKEKRALNSKLKNPKSKEYNADFAKKETKPEENEVKPKKGKRNQKGKKRQLQESKQEEGNRKKPKIEEPQSSFVGVEAKKGVNKMRSRYNLKTQAQLHHQSMKAAKKKEKSTKKSLQQRKQEFIRQPGQKIKKKTESDSFSKLVNSYKSKLMSAPKATKQKWYEGT